MSYANIWIHAVWGTKNRLPLLANSKSIMIQHIKENAIQKKIFIDCIDGGDDHLHCLFKLNANTSLMNVLQLFKGEASHWANQTIISNKKFEWADEYYAASVSESQRERVRRYNNNQTEHHKKVTFMDEYNAFLALYNSEL